MAVSLLLAALAKPAWESKSDLMVLLGPEYGYRGAAGDNSAVNAAFDHDEILGTEIGILTSRDLHRETLQAVGLATVYPDLARGPGLIARILARLRRLAASLAALLGGSMGPPAPPDPIEAALPRFAAHLSTLGERQASIVQVAFSHADPQVAQRVLATLERLYLARRQAIFADPQSNEVDAEVAGLQAHLQEAEQKLSDFKAHNGITNFATRLDILLHEQGDIERDLQEASSQRSQDEARLASLHGQAGKTPAQITESRGSDLETRLSALRASVDALRGKRQELLSHYRAGSAPVRALDEQIAARASELRAAYSDTTPGVTRTGINPVYIAANTDQLRTAADLRAAQAREQRDATRLATLASEITALNDHDRVLGDLTRNRQVIEDSYKEATRMRDARRVSERVSANRQGNVRIIRQPDLPLHPAGTRRLILLSGVLSCAMAACAMVIAGNFFRRSFIFPGSFEAECAIPVLAVIAERLPAAPELAPDLAHPIRGA
jgi:uncharacterized protein involved in exopolysaccharide biosynthesis